MKQTFRFPAHLQPALHPWLSLGAIGMAAVLTALAGLGGLSGCKAVDLSSPPDTTSHTADSAQISVTNDISSDPDSLILLLYSENAVDVSNGSLIKALGGIGVGRTLDVKVPVGKWKLAYRNLTGIITPMTDKNSGGAEWLKAIFVKNARYSLILKTDGAENVWVPTFKTDPEMQ